MPSEAQARITINRRTDEQRRIVAELDAEAAQMESVRALLPRYAAKIQRVLDRVWGQKE